MPTVSPIRIAVVIASVGRPVELGRWADHIRRQTVAPDELIYAVTKPSDLPPADLLASVKVIRCDPGLPVQRNAGLAEAIKTANLIAYFDDDYVPSNHCIEGIARFFQTNPDVVGATGVLLADGINSAGIGYEEAEQLVAGHDSLRRPTTTIIENVVGLYGCNMVYRVSAIGEERFDEDLPAYAWQEDTDFAMRIARRGRLVRTDAFCGVHQGVKGARLSGLRLGYSQIVNPIYLVRKGTVPARYAARLLFKNLAANHAKALFPEPWIDRIGRCKGNWLGIFDALLGRDHPKNILTMRR
jgi:hypothetical protein